MYDLDKYKEVAMDCIIGDVFRKVFKGEGNSADVFSRLDLHTVRVLVCVLVTGTLTPGLSPDMIAEISYAPYKKLMNDLGKDGE